MRIAIHRILERTREASRPARMLLALLLLAGAGAAAQENPPAPPPADSAGAKRIAAHPLPALDLPEFVIMGSEQVSFAQSHKELIDLYRSERFTQRTAVGTREMNISTETPTSTASLLAPPRAGLYDGMLRAGLGRFLSPYAEGWYARKYPVGDLSLHALYENVKRFGTYPGLARGGFDISGGSFIHPESDPLFARSRVEGRFSFASESYPLGRWLYPLFAAQGANDWLFDRSVRDIAYEGAILSRNNPVLDYRARLFASHTIVSHAALQFQPLDFQSSAQENIFGGEITAGRRFDEWLLKGDFTGALYTQSSDPGVVPGEAPPGTPLYLRLGARGVTWLGGTTTLTGGLHGYLYRGNSGATSARLFPSLRLDYYAGGDWRGWIAFEPGVDRSSLRGLLARNSWLYDTRHMPTERRIDLAAGAEYRVDPTFHLDFSLRFLSARGYPQEQIFRDGSGIDTLFARFRTYYDGTSNLLAISLRARKEITPYDLLDASLQVNGSRNDLTEERLTTVPDIRIEARYERRFLFPLSIDAGIAFLGERQGAVLPAFTLPSAAVVWASASYRIWTALDLSARIGNLFDYRYETLPGYGAQPFFVMTALTWQF